MPPLHCPALPPRLDVPVRAAVRGCGLLSAAVALVLAGAAGGCSDTGASAAAGSPAGAASAGSLPAARSARFVKFEQVTEWSGRPWASVAEFNLIDGTGTVVDRTGWVVSADSSDASDAPANAVDGRPETLWHSRWDGAAPPPPPHSLTVALPAAARLSGFRYLPRQDVVGNGTIAQYRLYLSDNGTDWGAPVAQGDFTPMGAVTAEKTVVFAAQVPNRAPQATAPPAQRTPMGQAVTLPVPAADADADPLRWSAQGLPPGLSLAAGTGIVSGTPILPGANAVAVTVSDNKGATSTVRFDWLVEAPLIAADAPKPAAGEVRFVKLEQVSEIGGNPWGSVAELKLLDAKGAELPRTGWTASADSSDTSDKPGNAIDGNPASVWHSQWDGASPPPPHSLLIDLGAPAAVRGFRYLPRQDKLPNGVFAKFRFYTSANGVDWGRPVAEGDFTAMGKPDTEKTVVFK